MSFEYDRRKSKDVIEVFEYLKHYLLEHFDDARSTGREVTKRCHYCGDSKDRSSRHLYIGISKNGTISYHCFKCNTGGVVNAKFFRDLNIFDVDLINAVLTINRETKAVMITNYETSQIYNYHNNLINRINPEDGKAIKKLAYFNKRLGVSLSMDQMLSLKVIPNIEEYLVDNRIKFRTRNNLTMDELNLGFIGFQSIDNSHIVLRRLVPPEKVNPTLRERYTIYNLHNGNNGTSYYLIPGQVYSDQPCNICLAEGPFDILGVYLNMDRMPNSIFCSVNGKSNYGRALIYLLTKFNLPYIGSTVHIFSDSDVKERDLQDLYNTAYSINMPCVIHFNLMPGEKDYGVSGDRIKDTVMYRWM